MLEKFLDAPWFEKLFWIFFASVAAFIVYVFILMIIDMIGFHRPKPRRRARSAGGVFAGSEMGVATYESSGLSVETSDAGSGDSGSGDSGGGGDFSGGGGESGGGGSTGGW